MYAVVQVGSFQYKVAEGDTIAAQLIEGQEDQDVTLDKVLLFNDGQQIKIGQPFLQGAKVTAKILRHYLGEKVVSFKYKRRKSTSWKKGHRQKLTALKISKIFAGK